MCKRAGQSWEPEGGAVLGGWLGRAGEQGPTGGHNAMDVMVGRRKVPDHADRSEVGPGGPWHTSGPAGGNRHGRDRQEGAPAVKPDPSTWASGSLSQHNARPRIHTGEAAAACSDNANCRGPRNQAGAHRRPTAGCPREIPPGRCMCRTEARPLPRPIIGQPQGGCRSPNGVTRCRRGRCQPLHPCLPRVGRRLLVDAPCRLRQRGRVPLPAGYGRSCAPITAAIGRPRLPP